MSEETTNQPNADIVIICSSELIANVMQEHFNKKMFKKDIEIVDLKPTEDGYAFSLAFIPDFSKAQDIMTTIKQELAETKNVKEYKNEKRDNKGRFTKLKSEQNVLTDAELAYVKSTIENLGKDREVTE